jgi:predicted molibdopterin-dependent oxidoreductase YjgC
MTSVPVEIKRTYCRVCITACGLVAEVAGDQILKVRGDREHPLTKGYTCPKGRATGQVHHLEGAITRPMIRSTIDTYGPNAVAINYGRRDSRNAL